MKNNNNAIGIAMVDRKWCAVDRKGQPFKDVKDVNAKALAQSGRKYSDTLSGSTVSEKRELYNDDLEHWCNLDSQGTAFPMHPSTAELEKLTSYAS